MSLQLAKAELVPGNPLPLPHLAQHLLVRAIKEGRSQERVLTTIDAGLQQNTIQIINNHYARLKANHIYNAAVIIAEVKTGHVLSYVGNTKSGFENNEDVDVAIAPRSTGSILKPILYAAMIGEGKTLPHMLWPDIPTLINGYSPKNFSKEYDGVVTASSALIRSLNIPAVHELKEYRYEKLYNKLKDVGITTLTQPADHYGLSLILGGSEGTLWDITGVYASMARTLNNFFEQPGLMRYSKTDFHPLSYTKQEESKRTWESSSFLTAASIFSTFDVLQEVYRPGENSGWKNFSSTKRIAWKTGTSFGFRDGWAIGVNPDYVVGVWVGNADGEGRPGLTGTESAAPILFDVFSMLPGNSWFQKPIAEMTEVAICMKSGHRISAFCDESYTLWVDKAGLQTLPCPYHQKVFLSSDRKYRVHASCESLSKIIEANWFILPPVQEYYYKSKRLSYNSLPQFRSDCRNSNAVASMDLIYPKPNAKIFIPRELDGTLSNTLFEAAHRNPSATIFWHVDETFIGATKKTHKLELSPTKGNHKLTLIDEFGETIKANFKIE
ncbi:MAG: penicillin-binding transpeptidase domain-containing protein [Cyclobacteriaceae bacterium]